MGMLGLALRCIVPVDCVVACDGVGVWVDRLAGSGTGSWLHPWAHSWGQHHPWSQPGQTQQSMLIGQDGRAAETEREITINFSKGNGLNEKQFTFILSVF